jgi:aspartyl/asparaginyl beta-hydroxylase (cupin superfamily)
MTDIQAVLERWWPLPGKSNFNMTIRDLLISVLFFFLLFQLRIAAVIPLLFEPAVLAFPFNTISSLFLRTPRFWIPLTVEPRLQRLLDRFADIKKEVLSIKTEMPLFSNFAGQHRIATNQAWRIFPFFSNGKIHRENCQAAPILSSIILQIPSIRLAMLSVIEKGTYIKPHCGYTKTVLRVHLTIFTDNEDPGMERYIEVGGERYSWKEGELVAFDDSYLHSVVNNVEGKRIVLFLDVDRPYQTDVSAWLAKLMHKVFENSKLIRSLAEMQEVSVKH